MKLFALLLFVVILPLNAFDLTPYKRIVCLGDSITHGGYYHVFLQEYLAETDPVHPRRIINRGISGDTVPGLLKRVDKMLQTDKPDLVMIMIGTNDLIGIRFAEKDLSFDDAVKKYPVFNRFEKNLGGLINILNKAKVKVVLLSTPPYNESANPGMKSAVKANMNSTGVKNIQIIEQRLAKRKGAVWIDVYTPLMKNLQANDAGFPRGKNDRVHPSRSEHLIIAETILGKKYVPGKKAAAAEKYGTAQRNIQNVLLTLRRFPKDCTTPEARIEYQKKWVSKLTGANYKYHSKVLPSVIETIKDPDAKIRKYEKLREEAFQKLYPAQ